MTTAQTITIIILIILAIVSYFGTGLSKKEVNRFLFLCLLTLTTGLFILIILIQAKELNELKEKTKNKCPEYEKVENVYKIKN